MKILIFINVLIILFGCNSGADQNKASEGKYFTTELGQSQSPNGKRTLKFGERGSDTTSWVTQVLLDFGDCGGGVYSVSGRNRQVRAFWKGNDTVVIETKSEYKPNQMHGWMQCFSEKIKIVYVEK